MADGNKALRLAFILSATDNMTATLTAAANNANNTFSKFEQISAKAGQALTGKPFFCRCYQ
jgi:hypothetical protein